VTKNTFSSLGFLISALATAAYSCSSNTAGGDLTGLGSPSTTGKGGSAATGGTAGAIGAPLGGTGGGGGGDTSMGATGNVPIINTDAGSQAGTSGAIMPDAACGTGKASATLKPVNMLVMFDRSWSMNECGDGTTAPMGMGMTQTLDCPTLSRWDLTSAALTQFFQSPQAADLNVALRFFPDDTAGCTGFNGGTFGGPGGFPMDAGTTADAGTELDCDIPTCAKPLVDIAPLLADPAPTDAHEGALVTAVMAATPPGPEMPNPNPSTPTYAALGGAEQWATAYQMAHPEGQAVVVLVTDGEPYGCNTDPDDIAGLAGDANTTAGVLTYVVGLTGSSEAGLNQIAREGGTDTAFFVSDGNTATADLLAKLIAIKGMALSCDLDVPTNDERGMKIDPHLINVNYSSGDGSMKELGYVDSPAACGSELAWYYDDPANPTQIHLCEAACTTVKADQMATLEILAGCQPHDIAR
jgi:hypothetical protein